MNASFYIYDKSFFENGFKSAITPKSLIYVMPHHSFDVDIPLDFEFMEYVISQKKLDFELYS
jgi:CMP-N-acetylneuraminic acid synthetase